jgi:hypothetical protein
VEALMRQPDDFVETVARAEFGAKVGLDTNLVPKTVR